MEEAGFGDIYKFLVSIQNLCVMLGFFNDEPPGIVSVGAHPVLEAIFQL